MRSHPTQTVSEIEGSSKDAIASESDAALITVTDAAALKIAELIETENEANIKLRVYIEGGGCSGFKYEFAFDNTVEEDDTVIEKSVEEKNTTIGLLIDPMSLQFLIGAEIDYQSGIEERFIIRNPNARTTCGCGSSFSVDN